MAASRARPRKPQVSAPLPVARELSGSDHRLGATWAAHFSPRVPETGAWEELPRVQSIASIKAELAALEEEEEAHGEEAAQIQESNDWQQLQTAQVHMQFLDARLSEMQANSTMLLEEAQRVTEEQRPRLQY